MLTAEQIGGLVRAVIGVGAGFLIAKGVGSAEMWTTVGSSVAAAVVAYWSWHSNKPKV